MSEARFSISCPTSVSADDQPILTMRLANLGAERAYLPIRFAVATLGDVRLAIHEGELELASSQRVRLSALRAADFAVVEPGESVVAGYSLADGYRFQSGHSYTLNATLVSEALPAELEGYRVLTGQFEAQPTRLKVR